MSTSPSPSNNSNPLDRSSLETRLFPDKPNSLRIYAWSPKNPSPEYEGLLKVGMTRRDVNKRIRESQGQMQVKYTLHVDEPAYRIDGSSFTDDDVRKILVSHGFLNPSRGSAREWVKCSPSDVLNAIEQVRANSSSAIRTRQSFPMRAEQQEAVDKTLSYYRSIWAENPNAVPRFLWNAKMRFGKTFTAYQLAKQMDARRILVLTFKPAVSDSWQSDLESHTDFTDWKFFSAKSKDFEAVTADTYSPFVYFGSFQDLLGRDRTRNIIKAKNEWIHSINWDLVIFDEYHYGAWRDSAKNLFYKDQSAINALQETLSEDEIAEEKVLGTKEALNIFAEHLGELQSSEEDFLPITTNAYLYLSGTPFKALASGEFIEEQIFNWTYTDEQRAKAEYARKNPTVPNPYASLPEMRLLTYQMPDELLSVASQGEFDEFDLNEFFSATESGKEASFKHEHDVQKWLDIIRGAYFPTQIDALKSGARPPFPYSDVRLLPYMQHSFWFLPKVASCEAMANLLAKPHNSFWHSYNVQVIAGSHVGTGSAALSPVREAISDGHTTKTIVLSCGKLTTGVTIKQWSAILMLRNLQSPETYFQAAFRVQSPWIEKNPDGDDPNKIEIMKPVCFVFDFAPTRALRQIADYGAQLSPDTSMQSPESSIEDLVSFLPILAYDGSKMTPVDTTAILDIALSGTSATLLARKWKSALLVNVDNGTLQKIMSDPRALKAVMSIEGFRALGIDIFETIINKSESVKKVKKTKGNQLTAAEKKSLKEDQKDYKTKRKQVQEKLIKFATRIPAFMYLTDYRENTLQDIISKLEPELFKSVTGLSVGEFEHLVTLGVFNSMHMNQAVFSFRRYEDSSLSYTGIQAHSLDKKIGLYDTVVSIQELREKED
ncbi:DEAD/DEAH box helicase family protein [Rothia dentocariosa]|jgi:hypothetical protein|uniref:DEAD/DEAH box helicase family protein n=1 Tax=Rothia dentocariosa TaxID=2047 RepID=UPI00244755BB|nr:DEAD/DEAH box helicase family protein [Rothia dentocariosa]